MPGLVHKGLFKCPICGEIIQIWTGFQHLQERHNAKIEFRRFPIPRKPTAMPYSVYEWGKPFWEIGRQLIPEANWETEKIYNGEARCYIVDPQGNRATIGNPTVFTYELLRTFRENGIEGQYIRIVPETADILAQAKGSPAPWYAYAIILAIITVAIYVLGEEFKTVTEALYRIFVAPIPPEWRPIFFATIIGVVGIVAVGYAIPRLRGRG